MTGSEDCVSRRAGLDANAREGYGGDCMMKPWVTNRCRCSKAGAGRHWVVVAASRGTGREVDAKRRQGKKKPSQKRV